MTNKRGLFLLIGLFYLGRSGENCLPPGICQSTSWGDTPANSRMFNCNGSAYTLTYWESNGACNGTGPYAGTTIPAAGWPNNCGGACSEYVLLKYDLYGSGDYECSGDIVGQQITLQPFPTGCQFYNNSMNSIQSSQSVCTSCSAITNAYETDDCSGTPNATVDHIVDQCIKGAEGGIKVSVITCGQNSENTSNCSSHTQSPTTSPTVCEIATDVNSDHYSGWFVEVAEICEYCICEDDTSDQGNNALICDKIEDKLNNNVGLQTAIVKKCKYQCDFECLEQASPPTCGCDGWQCGTCTVSNGNMFKIIGSVVLMLCIAVIY